MGEDIAYENGRISDFQGLDHDLDLLPTSKSRDTKTTTNIKIPAQSNLDIVPSKV